MSILDEELSSFQWIQLKLLSLDKYWPALVDNTSMSAIGLILASVITVIVTWMLTRDNDASRFRPNTAFRRNQSNRNVTYQDDTSTSLKSRNQKGIFYLKITNEFTNVKDNSCVKPIIVLYISSFSHFQGRVLMTPSAMCLLLILAIPQTKKKLLCRTR